jgi:hypothetical protein
MGKTEELNAIPKRTPVTLVTNAGANRAQRRAKGAPTPGKYARRRNTPATRLALIEIRALLRRKGEL